MAYIKIHQIAGVVALILFAASFWFSLPEGSVDESNAAWLSAIKKEVSEDLVLLGELTAFMRIIGSVDIGASLFMTANLEVGQVISELTDTLEKAIYVGMSAAVLAELWGVVLLFAQLASPIALKMSLAIGGTYLIFGQLSMLSHLRPMWGSLASLSTAAFLGLWLIVPYAFNLTGWVAGGVVTALPGNNAEKVDNLHADILADSPDAKDALTFWSEANNIKTAFHRGQKDLPHKIGAFRSYLLERATYALCVGIFLPLGAAFLLWIVLLRFAEGLQRELMPSVEPT